MKTLRTVTDAAQTWHRRAANLVPFADAPLRAHPFEPIVRSLSLLGLLARR